MRLQDRRVLLAVTGGIAAYKAPMLVRALQEEGADIRVVRTRSAAEFVTDTTLSVLSRHPVHADLFAPSDEFAPVLHVGLMQWAEVVLVAPATANVLGKFVAGIADDLPTTLFAASTVPVLVAPAMESHMWNADAVQHNLATLRERGVGCVDPGTGHLASGASGTGRMAELADIVDAVETTLQSGGQSDLRGRRLLITAGPTAEDLDPVRFITNRSSGRMGFAVARRALERGARVDLVTGPTTLQPPAGAQIHPVRGALEMLQICQRLFDEADAAVLAAAVGDYRPATVATEKIKKQAGERVRLELLENPDISATLGAAKGQRVVVAFAMETEDGVARAKAKRERKQADMIVLNMLTQEGAGFGTDTNVVTLIDESAVEPLPIMSKEDVADRILDEVRDRLTDRESGSSR